MSRRANRKGRTYPGRSWLLPQARPRLLRWLAAVFVVATFFDNYTLSRFRIADNLASVVGLVLLVAFVVLRRAGVLDLRGARGWFVAFLLVTVLEQIAWSSASYSLQQSAHSFRLYLQYVQVIVLYFIFSDLARDPRLIRNTGRVFVLAVMAMSILVNLGFLGSSNPGTGRVGVGDINFNLQSFLYAIGIVTIFCWILARWPRLGAIEIGLIVGACSMVVAAANTGSRGGAAALLVGLAVAAALSFRRKRFSAWMVAVPLAIGGIAFGLVTNEVLRGRAEATIYEGDTGLRVQLSQASLGLMKDDPLMGRGALFASDLGSSLGLGRRIGAHNAYFELLLAFGVLGFIPWAIGVAVTTLGVWRSRASPWGPLFLALLAATLCFAAVSNLAHVKYFWILLAVLANAGVMAREPFAARRVQTRARQSRWREARPPVTWHLSSPAPTRVPRMRHPPGRTL